MYGAGLREVASGMTDDQSMIWRAAAAAPTVGAEAAPTLAVIVVSYNTRALTLRCLQTLHAATRETRFETILFDNASPDGSAEAVAAAFPGVRLVRSADNLGFGRANNAAAAMTDAEWLLLLNPDTEVHDGAIDRLMAFAAANPDHGVYGGRTVFPDGSLNIASCWGRMTPWSTLCMALGLSAAFRGSEWLNPEGIGGWRRDSVREVDVVVGCFLLIRRSLWTALGGFDARYWMYGEDADLCLRAARLGARPVITPDAAIMHLVGAASATRADKVVMVARARVSLMRDHWPAFWRPLGPPLMLVWAGSRLLATRLAALVGGEAARARAARWAQVWASRRDWLAGY